MTLPDGGGGGGGCVGRECGVGGCDTAFLETLVSAWSFLILGFVGDTGLEQLLGFVGVAGLELLLDFDGDAGLELVRAEAGLTKAGGRALCARGLAGFVLQSFLGEAGAAGVM